MRRGLLLAGFGAYVLGLIASAPATLVDAGLRRASDGQLRLAEAQGTLWSGSGQIEIRATGGQVGVAKNLAWRFLPTALLHGQLVCEVEWDHAARPLPVTISWTQIELANADINLPATVLGLGVPKLAPLGLAGEVSLHIERLFIGRGGASGNATLQWRNASSALAPVAPLGDYELRLENDGTTTHAVLRTLQGSLQLDGKGKWASGERPVFSASARISPQHQRQLAPFLRMIAVERGAGSFELPLP